MIGENKYFETTTPSRDVWGDFNGKMTNSFLVNLDELSKKETMECEGQIKGLITNPRLTINNKGVNQFEIVSYHRFINTTNSREPINTSKDDRRNLIIESSDEKCGDKEYFNNLYDLLNDVNVIKTCYEYFKAIPDMNKFNLIPIPKTEYQNNLKELSVSPIEQWLNDFTLTNFDKNEVELLGTEALDLFKLWCKNNGFEYNIDAKKLGVRLTNFKIDGIEKGRHTKKGDTKIYKIEKLKKYFGIGCLINLEKNNNNDELDGDE
jgi:phage/plasmid-associated DNA primase